MIYLGSPYSDEDKAVMEQRYLEVECLAASMLNMGLDVFSPIAHCHGMAVRFALPRDHEFWLRYNFHTLDLSEQLWVHRQDGWQMSKGLHGEIDRWTKRGFESFMNGGDYEVIRFVALHEDGDRYLVSTARDGIVETIPRVKELS